MNVTQRDIHAAIKATEREEEGSLNSSTSAENPPWNQQDRREYAGRLQQSHYRTRRLQSHSWRGRGLSRARSFSLNSKMASDSPAEFPETAQYTGRSTNAGKAHTAQLNCNESES